MSNLAPQDDFPGAMEAVSVASSMLEEAASDLYHDAEDTHTQGAVFSTEDSLGPASAQPADDISDAFTDAEGGDSDFGDYDAATPGDPLGDGDDEWGAFGNEDDFAGDAQLQDSGAPDPFHDLVSRTAELLCLSSTATHDTVLLHCTDTLASAFPPLPSVVTQIGEVSEAEVVVRGTPSEAGDPNLGMGWFAFTERAALFHCVASDGV